MQKVYLLRHREFSSNYLSLPNGYLYVRFTFQFTYLPNVVEKEDILHTGKNKLPTFLTFNLKTHYTIVFVVLITKPCLHHPLASYCWLHSLFFVICLGIPVYAQHLHHCTGGTDLSSIIDNADKEGTIQYKSSTSFKQ